jgi:hypothetical protein
VVAPPPALIASTSDAAEPLLLELDDDELLELEVDELEDDVLLALDDDELLALELDEDEEPSPPVPPQAISAEDRNRGTIHRP